jgi:hypothetical protein
MMAGRHQEKERPKSKWWLTRAFRPDVGKSSQARLVNLENNEPELERDFENLEGVTLAYVITISTLQNSPNNSPTKNFLQPQR